MQLRVRASELVIGRSKYIMFDSQQEHSDFLFPSMPVLDSEKYVSVINRNANIPEDHTNPHEVHETWTLELEPMNDFLTFVRKISN